MDRLYAAKTNTEVLDNQVHFIENTSTGLISVYDLYFVYSNEPIAAYIHIGGDCFKLYNVENTDVSLIDSYSIDEFEAAVPQSQSASYNVRKIGIVFAPTKEQIYEGTLEIAIRLANNSLFTRTVTLKAKGTKPDQRLITLLSNNKRYINNDFYTAFFDSDYQEELHDNVLLNRKRKEFLLELFNIVGFMGSYRSLIAVINYFGYGELLDVREIWQSLIKDRYKYTSINNAISEDLSLAATGFKKTNLLQLVYQINASDGTIDPDDGFENYINILFNTDEILVKMWAIQRILATGFLPLNTSIVDIVGEFTATLGIDTRLWQHDANIFNIDLTGSSADVTIAFDPEAVTIRTHKVKVDPWSIEFTPDPQWISGLVQTSFDDVYFTINEIIDDAEDNVDLSEFYVDAFGLIAITIEGDVDNINRYQYQLFKEDGVDQLVYTSDILSISTIGEILLGIKDTGNFRFVIYLYDNYGGVSRICNEQHIAVFNQEPDFKTYKLGTEKRALMLPWSARETSDTDTVTSLALADALSWETLDVNTFDQIADTYIEQGRIDIDEKIAAPYFSINEMSGTAIENYCTPMTHHGYVYGLALIDLIGDGATRDRNITLKLFSSDVDSGVTVSFTNGGDEVELIQTFINKLNAKGGFYDSFSYHIEFFNSTNNIADTSKPMLRVIAKEIGLTASAFFIETDSEILAFNDAYAKSPISANMTVYYKQSVNPAELMTFTIGDREYTFGSRDYTVKQALIDDIEGIPERITVYDIGNDVLLISAREDLTITHKDTGLNKAYVRGEVGGFVDAIQYGSDVNVAEPLYAFIDYDVKFDHIDAEWTLTNATTGDVLSIQRAEAFRVMILRPGSYTLKLIVTDRYGTLEKVREGVFLVGC